MTLFKRLAAFTLSVILACSVSGAEALPLAQMKPLPTAMAVSFDMPVLGPFAYVHFCVRYPDECKVRGRAFRRPHAVELTGERWAALVRINGSVNRSIRPMSHTGDTTYDTWRILPRAGDCNDYAVSKRHELIAAGWPTRAVLLSEVVTSWGEHHLVLLVRTDRGDFVLDNLRPQVMRWTAADYRWVRVQSPTEPVLWTTIVNADRKALS